MTTTSFWIGAARHIIRTTTRGIRDGVADVRHARHLAPTGAVLDELGANGVGTSDPFLLAEELRRHAQAAQRAENGAQDWLETSAPHMPGLRELSEMGNRPLAEFRDWMTREHSWTPEGSWPQGLWHHNRDLVTEKWAEHVDRVGFHETFGMG